MATQCPAIDAMLSTLSPLQLAILNQPLEMSVPSSDKCPDDFHSPQARELANLGETEKAQRHEDCQMSVRAVLCKKNGHLKGYERWRCMERFCPSCAKEWAIAQFNKCGRPLTQLVERIPEHQMQLSYLRISRPATAIGNKQIKELVKGVHKSIRKLTKKHKFGEQEGLVGFENGRLTMKAIVHYGGPTLSEEQFQNIWPEAEVKVSPVATQYFETILREVLSPDLPETPADRARLEVACAKVNLGRRRGTFYVEVAKASKEIKDAKANITQPGEHCCIGENPGPTKGVAEAGKEAAEVSITQTTQPEEACCIEENPYTTKSEGTAGSHNPTTRQRKGRPCPKCGDTEEVTTPLMRQDELKVYLAGIWRDLGRDPSDEMFGLTI
jgi:hypothetical protein